MLEIFDKNFIIDGKKEFLLAGEIHYFRLDRCEWEKRLLLLKQCGGNTVSTYVPWLCHEEKENLFDFNGTLNERLDLVTFLNLAKKHELYVLLRPGPFVMAELKNEGLPFWLYEKYPDIIPCTWNKNIVSTATIDYLNVNFINKMKNWYAHLYEVIEPFLHQNGGRIIGIQLDNEVGMLSWVSNNPDLTDGIIADFRGMNNYDDGFNFYAPNTDNLKYHLDLCLYNRTRFYNYIQILKNTFKSLGLADIFYFVNIHGSSAGRCKTFPIGISQLQNCFLDPEIIMGTDIYMGEITIGNFHDLYISNVFTDSLNHRKTPLSALEFNVADSNFGDNLMYRDSITGNDFKIRMSISLGNKLLNYYLFCGGYNYLLENKTNDGNNRIAITGERHGFAAPISPEGLPNYTFQSLLTTTNLFKNIAPLLLDMKQPKSKITAGFISEYFTTEYCYYNDTKRKEMIANLELYRTNCFWDNTLRHTLLLHHSFDAICLDRDNIDSNTEILLVGLAKYLSRDIQIKLVNFLKNGGKMIITGEIPVLDMCGNKCTVLSEYINMKPLANHYDWEHKNLSIDCYGIISNIKQFRSFLACGISANADAICKIHHNNMTAAVLMSNICYIGCSIPGNLSIMENIYKHFGIEPMIKTSNQTLLYTNIIKDNNSSFLTIINLDFIDTTTNIAINAIDIFDGYKMTISAQKGYLLPINVMFDIHLISWSQVEIVSYNRFFIEVMSYGKDEKLYIQTKPIASSKINFIKYKEGFLITILMAGKCKIEFSM